VVYHSVEPRPIKSEMGHSSMRVIHNRFDNNNVNFSSFLDVPDSRLKSASRAGKTVNLNDNELLSKSF